MVANKHEMATDMVVEFGRYNNRCIVMVKAALDNFIIISNNDFGTTNIKNQFN
jgi:hypothetical protein